jgi:2-polyprenyl-3-methyl-5-hydroxy-6-metoxy-1,4-benzoquinol methylase
MNKRDKVRQYYNEHIRDEDERLDYHSFELPLTLRYIHRYLPENSRIFDTACGTGHYAHHLLKRGMAVGLNDLSDKNINHVRRKFGNSTNVLFTDCGDIMKSQRWDEFEWDAILILGPMYHLVSRENRLKLMKRAAKAIKPSGLVFTSFMTRTGALVYGIKNNPQGVLLPGGARALWKSGTDNRFIEATEQFTNAYFSHPSEIEPLLQEAGLEPVHLAGAEGIFGERFELFHNLDEKLQDAWMEFIFDHCEEREMLYHSKHLLSISRKIA